MPDPSSARGIPTKDYYPTISELVWANDDDINRLLSSLPKDILICLVRECVSQLKVSWNKEAAMAENLKSLSSGISDLKSSLPKMEKTMNENCHSIYSDVVKLSKSVESIPVNLATPPTASIPKRHMDESAVPPQLRIDGIEEFPNKSTAELIDCEHAAVSAVFDHLSETPQISDVIRLGKLNKDKGRPRTLLVTLNSVVAKSSHLRSFEKRVFISRGRSKADREQENACLYKRRQLLLSGISSTRLKLRSLKLYLDDNPVDLSDVKLDDNNIGSRTD